MSLEAVVTRSARPKPGVASAKAIVVAPFADDAFASSPGGDGIATRQYDPGVHDSARETIADPLELSFQQGTVTAAADALAEVVFPLLGLGDPPGWIATRGHEVRAFDRRLGREVFGPHSFSSPADIVVTNGLVRYWVMSSADRSCFAVGAVNDDSWHHVGYLVADGVITAARILELSPDGVVMAITVDGSIVEFETRRGERMIRASGGSGVAWGDIPPTLQQFGAPLTAAGKFRSAAAFAAADLIEVAWPVAKEAWTFAGWWVPDAASSTQGDSGIFYARDATALASTLMYRDGALEWKQDGVTLTSAPLTFAAGQPVFVALSYSATARRMSVKVGAEAIAHVADVVGAGTAEDNFTAFVLAPMFADLGGYSDIYSDTYGVAIGTWAFDNAMVFEDGLLADEAGELAEGVTGLDGLPAAESRLAWYASFDDPAASGLTRGIVTVGDDQGAYLAKAGADLDDVADHVEQFGAEFEQQIRLRAS